MEKKYYDIIVSLVKQNDKYAGCEPILEDIVQDVYEHSKVVFGAVTNEDVILAYLNKVIATSLITVPKKLNYNTKTPHRIISNVGAITKSSVSQEKNEETLTLVELETSDLLDKKEELTIESELLRKEHVETKAVKYSIDEEVKEIEAEIPNASKIIEVSTAEDTDVRIKAQEKEVAFTANESEAFAIDMQDEATNEIDKLLTESVTEPQEVSELMFEDTTENNETEDLLSISESEQDVNKTLVDKMINGASVEIENSLYTDTTESLEAIANTDEDINFIFESDETESSSLDIQDDNSIQIEEFVEKEEKPSIKPLETSELMFEDTTENNETEDLLSISESEQDVNKTLVDEMINGISAEIEDFSYIEATEPLELIEEPSEEAISLNEEKDDSSEIEIEEQSYLEESTQTELNDNSDLSDTQFVYKTPTFECFNYKPEPPEFFEEEICADLQEFDKKHPEQKLLQICKLKYKENCSVSEIAERLEFSEETVLDTLNDIIELVKD